MVERGHNGQEKTEQQKKNNFFDPRIMHDLITSVNLDECEHSLPSPQTTCQVY